MTLTQPQLAFLGFALSQPVRDELAGHAARLRAIHAAHRDEDGDDVLLELADIIDMIAAPILVEFQAEGKP